MPTLINEQISLTINNIGVNKLTLQGEIPMIKTNKHYRPILTWYDLTDKEQADIIDDYDTVQESSFFRYKGQVYDLNDFMREPCEVDGQTWDASHGTSYFSGVVINLSNDGDSIQVGYWTN